MAYVLILMENNFSLKRTILNNAYLKSESFHEKTLSVVLQKVLLAVPELKTIPLSCTRV